MTITVELKPAVQAELLRRAASSGKPVEDYAASLLEEAVQNQEALSANNLEDLFAPVRGMFEDGELDFTRDSSLPRPIDLS